MAYEIISTREYMERHPDEHLSWCHCEELIYGMIKPISIILRRQDGEIRDAYRETETTYAHLREQGILYIVSDTSRSIHDRAEHAGHSVIHGADLDSMRYDVIGDLGINDQLPEGVYTWDEILMHMGAHPIGCSRCPWRDQCECMDEPITEEEV